MGYIRYDSNNYTNHLQQYEQEKNVSIERQHFYKWFCVINLHYFLGSSWKAMGILAIFHSVTWDTKVHVHRHVPSISVSASGEDNHINKWSKLCLVFSPQGNEIQMVSLSSMEAKEKSLNKSLNKIDYNQLHSLMQDDRWSDFSEGSLVKLNFKIFNTGGKISRWKPKFYRELEKKKTLPTCFLLLMTIKKPSLWAIFKSGEDK